jgi:predicted metal-dependent hydrolase
VQRLQIGDGGAPLVVRRNARAKRLSMRLDPDAGAIIVVLPRRAQLEDAIGFARANAGWIDAQLRALPPRIPFADGAVIPVLGRERTIRHEPGRSRGVCEEGEVLSVGGTADQVTRRLVAWLKREATVAIESRIVAKGERLGRKPRRVVLRDTRSRWGSCSATGTLSFSWRLVFAPPEVLDYVVAHEMAHLMVRGHGPDFWRLAGELAEDLASGRIWLRRHGRALFRYG